MPRRIIIHAGFHKTGTSTVQAVLRENRVAMKKQVALRLRWHLRDVVAATRGYSIDQDPLTLIKAQTRFGAVMNELPGMPRRTLILSAEELCGHLPGHSGLKDYAAAPVLLYAYWEIAKARFPQAEILIFLTLRKPDAWLASAHWEHVRSSDMTMTLNAFRAQFYRAADLRGMANEIAARVPVPVHVHTLENCRDLPLGPADPLLDLCDLPLTVRAGLVPVPAANQRLGEDVLQAMIEVNRTTSDSAARNAAKAALISKAQGL
ncbi:MAG: hypothetical protein ABJL67_06575 [Sulfitobacter sp.]